MAERAQTFTLEAVFAVILVLGAVAFGLQVVSISANTASVGDAETRAQHVGLAAGVLEASVADGTLEATVLYWNATDGTFHDADDEEGGFYIARPPPTEPIAVDGTGFGDELATMTEGRHVRYNVDLYYRSDDGIGHQRLVESGTPSDGAVRVSETVTLYDGTALLNESGVASTTLGDTDDDADRNFYAPDAHPDSRLYNVVRVEVTLWQT